MATSTLGRNSPLVLESLARILTEVPHTCTFSFSLDTFFNRNVYCAGDFISTGEIKLATPLQHTQVLVRAFS